MLDFLFKHKKIAIISGIVILVLIAMFSVYFIIEDMAKTATVNVVVAPNSATVRIGDNIYVGHGDYRVRPGEYNVEVSADGFKTKTGNLKAIENETVEIRVYLEPAEGNEDYYLKNPVDGTILGDLKAAETMKKIEELAKKYPILKKLPVEIDYYTDNYSKRIKYTLNYTINDDYTSFSINIIDYTGGNREAAMKRLKNIDANVEKYTINYTNKASDLEWGHAE